MKRTYWKDGDHSAICDVCGFKFKASQLKLRWDGLRVCREDFEVRHPQELIRSIPDQIKLNWTRPESTNTFIFDGNPTCTVEGSRALPGFAVAGCSISGRN